MIRFAAPALLALIPVVLGAGWWVLRNRAGRYALRGLVILLALLALAGPQLSLRRPERCAYLLVDRSASVARAVSAAQLYDTGRRVAEANADRTFGMIEFAADASVVSSLGAPLRPLSSVRLDGETNLTRAVDLAIRLLPAGAAGELVLLSDGRATDDVAAAIAAAQLAGVAVSVLPVGEEVPEDVTLVAFRAPSEVPVDRPFTLEGEIEAAVRGRATVALYRDGELLRVDGATLDPGRTFVSFTDTLVDDGSSVYQLVVKAEGDPIVENDRLSRLVRTTTSPSILLVDRSETSIVESLLEAAGLAFARQRDVPSLETLSSYSQLVLSGVPLDALTSRETSDIERFARNLGGGVLLIQGEDEVRGFAASPIEDLLPVSYSVPEKEQEPSLAIVYLLDRSSSMRALTGSVAKIRILRNAAAASITLLPGDTLVGVIAFDDVHQWMVPIAPVGEGVSVYAALRNIRAQGGTDIFFPLDDALERLANVDARSKHMILISDGKTTHEARDFVGLLERLRVHEEITLSAIALGETPNLALLGTLVEAGHGALYHVTDFLKLPQLTMQVTQRLSRSRFVTGEVDVAGPLADAAIGEIPPLQGYVLTYPRASARTGLWVGEDPLFSSWQVGLGPVSVLNTDLDGAWSEDWVVWPRASALFEALLSATTPTTQAASGLRTSLAVDGAETSLTVDARDPSGNLADFLDLEARVLPTDVVFEVPQVGPGLYHATFPTPAEGGYALRLVDRGGGRTATVSLAVPYRAEYRRTGIDRNALDRIARMTGGAILDGDFALPQATGDGVTGRTPIDRYLLLAALALFLVDLGIRKIPRRRPLPTSSKGAA